MNQPLPILVLPIGTPAECIAEARFAGYLPILCDDPAKVRIVNHAESADRHDMLMAAMAGLTMPGSDTNKCRFFHELYARIKASETL